MVYLYYLNKNLKRLFTISLVIMFLEVLPADFVMAQGVFDLTRSVGQIINLAIPIVFAMGILFFIWGIVKYISVAGSEQAMSEARGIMIWGVVVIFITSSVWGIVKFVQGDLFGGSPLQLIETIER